MAGRKSEAEVLAGFRDDWNKFIRDALGARLTRYQRRAVEDVQHNRRTAIWSGHAMGKDFLSACISLTFVNLYIPSRVINTAPTQRQAINIEMAEIARLHRNAKIPLGGKVMSEMIKFYDYKTGEPLTEWYLMAFKAANKSVESWTGFHSPNILVVITEASGLDSTAFTSLEGLLTGTLSRLLIVFNPNKTTGEAFNASRSPKYKKHKFSCLDSVNVRAKKILVPGLADYEWVKDKVGTPGWSQRIPPEAADPVTMKDFKFEGLWYRPTDYFLAKVMGEFPREGDDQLVPLSWIEEGIQRWYDRQFEKRKGFPKLGCDIAGMGNDVTALAPRYDDFIDTIEVHSKMEHMETAGIILNHIRKGGTAFVDTIGEGAGVHSRLKETIKEEKLKLSFSVSAKFSEQQIARTLTDVTGERKFKNMRAYCLWAVRDALDPQLGNGLAIPPDDELTQELSLITFHVDSLGFTYITKKEDIKTALGRSPDKSDAVALSFWPSGRKAFGVARGAERE